MTGKFKVVLIKNTFLLKSVRKQNITIKILTYLCLITKAAKREHVNICFAALCKVHAHRRPMSEWSFV
jgi:hypothetical protein